MDIKNIKIAYQSLIKEFDTADTYNDRDILRPIIHSIQKVIENHNLSKKL